MFVRARPGNPRFSPPPQIHAFFGEEDPTGDAPAAPRPLRAWLAGGGEGGAPAPLPTLRNITVANVVARQPPAAPRDPPRHSGACAAADMTGPRGWGRERGVPLPLPFFPWL